MHILIINEEVERLLANRMIWEVQYPYWIFQRGSGGKEKWQIKSLYKVNQSDKACPKDSFLLPKIVLPLSVLHGKVILTLIPITTRLC